MPLDPKVIDARNKAEAKRAQLLTSVKYGVGEAKRRLAPDLVADHVWDVTKDKARRAADDMMLTAKDKPWIVGAIGAAIGLFLARGAIGEVVRDGIDKVKDRFDGNDEAPAVPNRKAEDAPDTPVAVAKQAKRQKSGAAKAKTPTKNSKTEDVK